MLKKTLLGFVMASVLMAVLSVPPALAEEAACVQAQKWVEAHRDSLPTTYDQYLDSPAQYRRAISGALPPATKAALWTEHIHRYVAAHPELSADQLALIQEALDLVGRPDTFVTRTPEQKRTALAVKKSVELGNHAKLLFDHDEIVALLVRLDATPTAGERPGHEKPQTKIERECDCAFVSDWCYIDEYCKIGNCTTPVYGCGILELSDCDGLCKRSGVV